MKTAQSKYSRDNNKAVRKDPLLRKRETFERKTELNFRNLVSEVGLPKYGKFGYFRHALNVGINPKRQVKSQFIEKFNTEFVRPVPFPRVIYNRITEFNQADTGYFNSKAASIVEQRILSGLNPVRPVSLHKAYDSLPKDTSPGFPLRDLYSNKREAKVPAIKWAHYLRNALRHDDVRSVLDLVPPCQAVARRAIQRQGVNKSRLIWAYPMSMSLIEATFSKPLYDILYQTNLFGWSVEYLSSGASRLYDEMWGLRCHGNSIRFGLDWEKFDAHVQARAINWAFSVLKRMLDLDFDQAKQFELVREYFLNTPLMYRKRCYRKVQGVPSGSGFTQIIDSLVNMYIHTDLILSVSINESRIKTWDQIYSYANFLGDDSIIRLKFGLDRGQFNEMLRLSSLHHNQTCSTKKSWAIWSDVISLLDEDDPDRKFGTINYLGKTIVNPLHVIADLEKVKAAALLPENADKGPEDALTRLIGLAWSSGTSRQAHEFLLGQYNYILGKHPGVRPRPFKAEERRWLALITTENLPLHFPTFRELCDRYALGRF